MSDISITLRREPYLSLTPPCVTVIAETPCEFCGELLGVMMVERESSFHADAEYVTRLRTEIIETLLRALAEHQKENHGNPPDERP